MAEFRSDLSGRMFPLSERVSAKTIRHAVLHYIQKSHPDFAENGYLSLAELHAWKAHYLADHLQRQLGALSDNERQVLASISDQSTLSAEITPEKEEPLTFGQRIADRVASFGGSWTFILSFLLFIAVWTTGNIIWLRNSGFDPYPFILLNLILSCLAALQAPVIMMSQNRQEEKDRERARKDYMINLKAEIEVRTLQEKLDHLLLQQQQEMLEIRQHQLEILQRLRERGS
ncbi:DUF1003 domain-containing protein [Leptonema illini]|uniref:Cyclic nucleotide-binding protein n=1 Tax=Leptonema illini DSM 21528 TaxID=929563 RepID=H2CKU2_9LEPT|nr:DUF1003 domain-containing protein [Leptonema illini]EHQ06176.1 protein of unknown function DUF1003 [Leptonema illini DSM 21528]